MNSNPIALAMAAMAPLVSRFVLHLRMLLVMSVGTACQGRGQRHEKGRITETPRAFAERFYKARLTWRFLEEPRPQHTHMIVPFFGHEALQVFRQVNEQRAMQPPLDPFRATKPFWSDGRGDVFCDQYEGYSRCNIGSVKEHGSGNGAVVVEAILQGNGSPWTDRLILDRDGQRWVIRDIEYARGGSLLEKTRSRTAEFTAMQSAKRMNCE